MGRLIDADNLEKELLELCGDNPPMFHYFSEAIKVIREQPTAYDVDKVWNEITDRAGKATTKGAYRTYWECAKIVKGAVKVE